MAVCFKSSFLVWRAGDRSKDVHVGCVLFRFVATSYTKVSVYGVLPTSILERPVRVLPAFLISSQRR